MSSQSYHGSLQRKCLEYLIEMVLERCTETEFTHRTFVLIPSQIFNSLKV